MTLVLYFCIDVLDALIKIKIQEMSLFLWFNLHIAHPIVNIAIHTHCHRSGKWTTYPLRWCHSSSTIPSKTPSSSKTILYHSIFLFVSTSSCQTQSVIILCFYTTIIIKSLLTKKFELSPCSTYTCWFDKHYAWRKINWNV